MFDRFTYKQKNYGLLVVFILLAMVSYKRSLSLTFNAFNELDNQAQQLESTKHVNEDIETLRIQIAQLNKNIGKSDIQPDLVHQEILGEISEFSDKNDVNLEKLEETHAFKTVDFTIYSNLIMVEGSFNGILSLIYHMENHFQYARLTNVDVYKEKELQKKKEKLYGKLLFQHYRQN
ncbi:MAG: hypothetical protein HUJ25_17850 [Crocinitomicaceae bacterium]|nr:hypothetical protein [Crocinitomicaceae bacterium]